MGLSLLVSTRLFSKIHAKNSTRACTKTEFNVKMAIQGHVLWDQWKADEQLHNDVGLIS